MHNGSAEIKFDPGGWWGFSIQGHFKVDGLPLFFVFSPGQSLKVHNGLSLGVFFLSLFFLTGQTGGAARGSSENLKLISWLGCCPLKDISCHHICCTFPSFNCVQIQSPAEVQQWDTSPAPRGNIWGVWRRESIMNVKTKDLRSAVGSDLCSHITAGAHRGVGLPTTPGKGLPKS